MRNRASKGAQASKGDEYLEMRPRLNLHPQRDALIIRQLNKGLLHELLKFGAACAEVFENAPQDDASTGATVRLIAQTLGFTSGGVRPLVAPQGAPVLTASKSQTPGDGQVRSEIAAAGSSTTSVKMPKGFNAFVPPMT